MKACVGKDFTKKGYRDMLYWSIGSGAAGLSNYLRLNPHVCLITAFSLDAAQLQSWQDQAYNDVS